MAGSDPRFPSAQFIAGIEFAQRMGMPVDPADGPTFHFADTIEYAETDSTGAPWSYIGDPEADVTPAAAPKVAVCGRKATILAGDATAVGDQTPLEMVLTFMPDAWAQVGDFTFMVMRAPNGQQIVYKRGRNIPMKAMFDVPIRKVVVRTGSDA